MAVRRNDILANYYKSANYVYIEGYRDFKEKKNKIIEIIDKML